MATPPPYAPDPDRYAGFESGTTFRRCGRSGLDLPAISLGLWHNFGDDRALDTQRAILRRAFDRGVTHFDLANNYGPPYGSAEAQLRHALRPGLPPVPRRADPLDQGRLRHVARARTGRAAARASTCSPASTSRCARMGVDYVDIFYSHRFDPDDAARGDDGRARHRRPLGQGALRRHLLLLGPERTREAVRDPARAGHAAADPPAVVLDAQPLDRGGPARRAGGDRRGLHRVLPARAGDAHRASTSTGSRRARGRRGTRRCRRTCSPRRPSTHVRALNEMAQERGQTLAQMALAWALRDERVTSVLDRREQRRAARRQPRRAGEPPLHRRRAGPDRRARGRRRHQPLGPVRGGLTARGNLRRSRRCPIPSRVPTVTRGERHGPEGERMTTAGKDVQTAIVLQGGGALGAYEYGVLQALYEQRPGFRPVAVAGISIGAITAAVLGGARSDPISALDTLWRAQAHRHRSDRCPPGCPRRSTGRWPLRQPGHVPAAGRAVHHALAAHQHLRHRTAATDARRARRPRDGSTTTITRVIVGATNVGTGVMEFFDSRRPGGLTFEHVAASGSLPPSFPMTRDRAGSRTGTAACSPTPRSARRSTRWSRRRTATAPWSASSSSSSCSRCGPRCRGPCTDVLQRMVQLQYTSRLTLDERFFDKISRIVDLMDRVDATLAAGQRRSATTRPTGAAGLPQDRSPQRGHLEPAPGAVQRRGLLAVVDRGPDPGGVRRRDRAGHRQTSTRRGCGSG